MASMLASIRAAMTGGYQGVEATEADLLSGGEGAADMDGASTDASADAAYNRMSAILNAPGIRGDGNRMSAALDLAIGSRGMSADQVAGFVKTNVQTAGSAGSTLETEHDRRRAAAMPHVHPDRKSEGDGTLASIMKSRHGIK